MDNFHREGTRIKRIHLIQVREAYYVTDGHHSVSVSRALDKISIDATVTVWELEDSVAD